MSYYISNGTFYAVPAQSDELMHYGVKGMRWGHRKAQQYESKARTARESAKEWSEIGANKANKLLAKGKTTKAAKVKAKYDSYAKQDRADAKKYEAKSKTVKKEASFQKAQADIGSKRSRGEKLVTNLVGGFYANRTFNSVKAAGGSNAAAWGVTVATGMLGGAIGHIAVSHLYTKAAGRDETRKRYN